MIFSKSYPSRLESVSYSKDNNMLMLLEMNSHMIPTFQKTQICSPLCKILQRTVQLYNKDFISRKGETEHSFIIL